MALGGSQAEGVPYALWLMAGAAPWFFFADALTGSASVFRDYAFLVKKLHFRAEYLPLMRVISALFVHLFFLGLVFFCLCLGGVPLRPGQLWALVWTVGGALLVLGAGSLFALWCACLRDVAFGLQAAVQLGFWLTPVFWSPQALPAGLRWIAVVNPAAVLVRGCRQALLFGQNLTPGEQFWFWLVTGVLNLAAWALMRRMRPTLADRL